MVFVSTMNNRYGYGDGFRFIFKLQHDGTSEMIDEYGQLPSVILPSSVAEVLSKLLADQHYMLQDKKNNFSVFKGILQVVKEEYDDGMDRDLLIECVRTLNFTDLKE